jgi:hypothetical protein
VLKGEDNCAKGGTDTQRYHTVGVRYTHLETSVEVKGESRVDRQRQRDVRTPGCRSITPAGPAQRATGCGVLVSAYYIEAIALQLILLVQRSQG